MADYYTNFSLIMALPDVAARTYALELHQRMEEHRDDRRRAAGVPKSLWEEREGWHFACQAAPGEPQPSLWLRSSDGGTDAACAFIQHLLHQFQLREAGTVEWSHDCSKPRTDAYGGGAAFITAHELRTFNTAEWVREQLEARKAKPHRFSLETQLCVQCGVHSDDAAVGNTRCRD